MALVNFYNKTPSIEQVASDLKNDEIVVFDHMPSGAKILAAQVEAQVDFICITHHENTIRPWNGEDYFVMVRNSFGYSEKREKLRAIALQWVDAGRPNQFKNI